MTRRSEKILSRPEWSINRAYYKSMGYTDTDLDKYSVYGQSAAADWASDTVVGSEAHGAVANETFMSGFADVIELYLNTRDSGATSAAAQELCVKAEICE